MPTVPSPQAVLDRVRRDVERNALRARNGIKLAAGIDRPGVGLTPKDVVWQRGRCQLWHYRNDDVRYAPKPKIQPLIRRPTIAAGSPLDSGLWPVVWFSPRHPSV